MDIQGYRIHITIPLPRYVIHILLVISALSLRGPSRHAVRLHYNIPHETVSTSVIRAQLIGGLMGLQLQAPE